MSIIIKALLFGFGLILSIAIVCIALKIVAALRYKLHMWLWWRLVYKVGANVKAVVAERFPNSKPTWPQLYAITQEICEKYKEIAGYKFKYLEDAVRHNCLKDITLAETQEGGE